MKKWYTSKTLWVNVLAVIAIAAQSISGSDIINAEAQTAILGVVNLVLRFITKEGLV